jgi:hypothetical protein
MRSMLATKAAVLAELELFRSCLFVFGGRVISLLALGAGEGDDISHLESLHKRGCGERILPARPAVIIR